jgi:site-specific recombinase XerD
MHPSIEQYLEFLHTKRRAPATLKVIRQDLAHFVAWWESHRRRTFDPGLLRHEDLRAAQQLRAEAKLERNITRSESLKDLARRLESVTPHMLRHSLARRMLERGAQLPEVQRVLGHSRLSTTGVYLTPSEEEVRAALRRAGI